MRNIPEKISRTKRRKYFFCHSGNEEHGDQNCRRSKFSKMLPLLSPLNHLSSRGLCPITINRDVTPLSQGPHITHLLSEELRFVVGTHFSIETSWPPALPAHHWITMVSLRGKEPISIVVQRLCSPAPPVGQSGGKAERGRFLGGASISVPLSASR